MASPRGRKSPDLIDRLVTQPNNFSFVQAIRLLERLALGQQSDNGPKALKCIGEHHHPKRECIRFNTETALVFPMSEISKLQTQSTTVHPTAWQMTVTFMGLLGPSGVLPHHYSELIIQRLKVNDHSMRDFFDMLNHRIISHFYRASIKYKMLSSFERSQLIQHKNAMEAVADKIYSSPTTNSSAGGQSQVLLALAGLGDPSQRHRLGVSDDSLIGVSGFLQQRIRSVKNLEGLIKFQFGLDATIEQFRGEWQTLQSDFQTRLSVDSSAGINNILGQNAILGSKVWQAQGKFSVLLKPSSWDELIDIAPDSDRLRALENLIHLYVGIELDFDFTIRYAADQIPRAQLKRPNLISSNNQENGVRLGWNCKIAAKAPRAGANPKINDKLNTLIRISRRAMQQTA